MVVFSRNYDRVAIIQSFVIRYLRFGWERAFINSEVIVMKPASLILTIFMAAAALNLAPAFAQNAPQPPPLPDQQQQQNAPLLTAEQLDTMVAPVALYPDPLLGQVLAASTYPLEVVEAQQWLQQNQNLHGQDLMNAARQQNWDPSVQALVAFPDVLTVLNRDVRWTGDLGNAYLAQQQDVMNAVQRMRFRARANGRLQSTPQQNVTTQTQNGQDAVVIEPASPQTVYVPVYNPDYVWGPPEFGYYPPLWYPSVGFGFGFGPGIFMDGFFPGWAGIGWGGWGLGWGWGCGWWGGGIYANNFFFNHYGFRGGFNGGFGRSAWQHDPYHRAGVPYANRSVATRFNNSRFAAGRMSAAANGSRSSAGRSFGGNAAAGRSFGGNTAAGRSFGGNTAAGRSFGGNTARSFNGGASPAARGFAQSSRGAGSYSRAPAYGGQAYRGNASPGARSYSAAPRSYSAPSAPRSFGGGGGGARSFGGGGGARSFGGGGGGHFGGGGGGHAGGGGGHGGGHR
jgi:hypothetical protein